MTRLVFHWQTRKEAYNICIETILKMFLILLYHAQGIIPLKEQTLSNWSLSEQEIHIKGVQQARIHKVMQNTLSIRKPESRGVNY